MGRGTEEPPQIAPRYHPARPATSPPAPGSLSPGTFPSPTSAPRQRKGARSPRLTCALDPGAAPRGAGRGVQASAARRLKLCCSRDGAVVTSSLNGRRSLGCDPTARAAARRALQPPAPPAPGICAPRARELALGSALPGPRGEPESLSDLPPNAAAGEASLHRILPEPWNCVRRSRAEVFIPPMAFDFHHVKTQQECHKICFLAYNSLEPRHRPRLKELQALTTLEVVSSSVV
ncbi:homeobox protein unc-4 homolog [Marmota monax]|uniref:homeobox protein unc-4 homolog n=1 Tax=Marmota monax TaxID=9995 RepID=UPI001EB080A6|nr:homeobox protein unc-4 homolog [Marmota monax]